eukprot:TRINITY_DN4041_c0_g1_i1.p1 TRINITY_DN4041_c0_g1~~TRINITY_DN4041_c0_g1_i1.p1  ORF type:complete len:423 (+),score=105.67 TRINITY_DN4041_c0_g1_i1:38-1270(+)
MVSGSFLHPEPPPLSMIAALWRWLFLFRVTQALHVPTTGDLLSNNSTPLTRQEAPPSSFMLQPIHQSVNFTGVGERANQTPEALVELVAKPTNDKKVFRKREKTVTACAKAGLICSKPAQALRKAAMEKISKGGSDFTKGMELLEKAKVMGCTGWKPTDGKEAGHGATCALWGYSVKWCWVDKSYNGTSKEFIKASKTYKDKYYAPCINDGPGSKILDEARKLVASGNKALEEAKDLIDRADKLDGKCANDLKKQAEAMRAKAMTLMKKAKKALQDAEAVLKEARLTGCNHWSNKGLGGECSSHGWTTEWCYVDKEYIGKSKEFVKESKTLKGKYYAPCDKEAERRIAKMVAEAKQMQKKAKDLEAQATKSKMSAEKKLSKAKEELSMIRRRRTWDSAKGKGAASPKKKK